MKKGENRVGKEEKYGKRLFFIAVTDEEGSQNRYYSDLVYSMCKKSLMDNKEDFDNMGYDVSSFMRHDMLTSGNLMNSIFKSIIDYDAFIVLLDEKESNKYNPNVWFELGMIATLDKPIILLSKTMTSYPFHVQNMYIVPIQQKLVDLLDNEPSDFVKYSKEHRYNELGDRVGSSEAFKTFSNDFVKSMKTTLKEGNPYAKETDHARLRTLGLYSLKELFDGTDLLNLINQSTVRAEYIAGERDAFMKLTEAVKETRDSLRTSRFANQSIVNSDDSKEIEAVHEEFMKAIYEVSHRESVRICDRIICNNNPLKWCDIYSALEKTSSKMRVFVRKADFSINFELVVIDEKVAFIHFYESNKNDTVESDFVQTQSGDNQNKETVQSRSKDQKINSTLKITGELVCKELANIFDRLHHRDINQNPPEDLSRTLLGVENYGKLTPEERKRGYFEIEGCTGKGIIAEQNRKKKIFKKMRDAYNTWEIKGEDLTNMASGLVLIDALELDEALNQRNLTDEGKDKIKKFVEQYKTDEEIV